MPYTLYPEELNIGGQPIKTRIQDGVGTDLLTVNSDGEALVNLGANVRDPNVGAITVIEETHRMIHSGFSYNTWHKFTGVADGSSVDLFLKVPADVFPHLNQVQLKVGKGDCDITLYEGPTTSNDGTALSERSLNRNGTVDASDLEVFHTPTVSVVGTAVRADWVVPTSTGTGPSKSTGVVDDSKFESILKPSTNYLLRLTNNSGESITVWMGLFWYEPGY